MPKYAVMTFMFSPWWHEGRMSHETMLAGFAAAGAQGIEPFHRDFTDDPALLPRYKRILDDNGLTAPVVDVICNLVYANQEQRRQGIDDLKRGLDVCKGFGTEIAHVAGHTLVDGVSPADGRQMIADGLLSVADDARAAGITLAIEDFDPSPKLVCSAADCMEIMRLSGDVVKFVFDTGNFMAVGERADQVFDQVADRICHCHFKDFVADASMASGYRGADFGAGDVPNAVIASKLNALGYDGWVALETRAHPELDPVSLVRQDLALLKSWF